MGSHHSDNYNLIKPVTGRKCYQMCLTAVMDSNINNFYDMYISEVMEL